MTEMNVPMISLSVTVKKKWFFYPVFYSLRYFIAPVALILFGKYRAYSLCEWLIKPTLDIQVQSLKGSTKNDK